MITKASECTVRVFMKALFEDNNQEFIDKNFEGGSDGLNKVYTEYVDISGIGQTREKELMTEMHNLQLRMIFITQILELHKTSLLNLEVPFLPAINDLKKYGHRLTWDIEYPEKFVQQIQMIDIKERLSIAKYDKCSAELREIKEKGIHKETNGRRGFISMLNRLGKHGFRIEKDITDMEELAVMIRDEEEYLKDQAAKNNQQ